MNKLEELKKKLMDELEVYGGKKELSAGDLAIVDTLSHSVKNLCKVIEDADPEYSGRYDASMTYGNSTRRRRDAMGRYSREYSRAADDVIGQLEEMMDTAPDEHARMKIRELIREMKSV